ncbi:STAS domain-containing protein [Streptomyces minutiscleroticus]|uniref:STAS domain-containing protein n=1 Tax=Streptomyces minutiscleroticus TaxID=68238 RepID=UPI00167E131C|nr:STAS domain-containing protein [Streptomyces minutiscleroticus]
MIRTVTQAGTIVRLQGEVDLGSAGRLRQALTADTADPAPRIVVDLGGVTFLDSSGINALVAAYRVLRDTSGWLRLAGPQPPVQRILELSGLAGLLGCYPDLRHALHA